VLMAMHLTGLGRHSWDRVRSLIGDQECAWMDLDGFQVGSVPAVAPPSTHLWSWSATRWVRVRVDGAGGIAGVLSLDPTAALGGEAAGEVEAVSVQLAQGILWPADDLRVKPLPSALVRQPWTLLTVAGLRPVTFVHRGPRPVPTGQPGDA